MAEAPSGFPAHLELPREVVEITETLERAGYETWVVGGALRDVLLGGAMREVDLATTARPEQVQALFSRSVAVGVRYGTVGVLDRKRRLHEVTTFRRDVTTDGRHAVVAYGVSLQEDLARRDFTINAMAYHPGRQEWADPFRGKDDLDRRIVRAVGQPADRFREDYLRILRALRFAARFDFAIDPDTWTAARAAAPGLAGLSAERVREEWFKGLLTARSLARLITLWQESGAAAIWLPELRETWPGVASAVEARDPVVLTALVCTDPGAVLARLHGSREEIERAHALRRGPHEPAGPEPAAVRRWLHAVGRAADDLLLLASFRLGTRAPWHDAVEGIRARGEATDRGGLAINGTDLLASGMPAGPAIGATLDRLVELVLDDPAVNTRERLLAAVRAWT